MTTYEYLIQTNDVIKQNLNALKDNSLIENLSKCFTFCEDFREWINCCPNFADIPLVKDAEIECENSIILCSMGFYKEAITALRQFFEHTLFSIFLSTNDYKYRLWLLGQYDMSWATITDDNDGLFSKRFVKAYAHSADDDTNVQLLHLSKTVYRECSEFVHGNFCKISMRSQNLKFSQECLEKFLSYFCNAQYVVCLTMFIRFNDIFKDNSVLTALEPILAEYLGTQQEILDLLGKEGD
ncbi:MAG: hypothetical protein MJZ22_00425 [Candidatus Saccharibacteria bacterium]|nr:hypothetical protein [Candidatus Saccharibacteria bacterium]